MVDIVITGANVLPGSSAKISNGTAGVALTAGQVVYLDDLENKYKLADNNSATVAARTPVGISLNSCGINQPVAVLEQGPITIGSTLVAGVAYYLSDFPGGICPVADLLAGEFPSIIGIATSTTVLKVNLQASGVAL